MSACPFGETAIQPITLSEAANGIKPGGLPCCPVVRRLSVSRNRHKWVAPSGLSPSAPSAVLVVLSNSVDGLFYSSY